MKIHRHISALPALLAALLLAGCATTDSTYSSLPPSPKHPANKAPMDRETVTIPGPVFPPSGRQLEQLPPEQYADILDRIRVGYRLPDVQHVAVDREIDL